MRYPLAHSTWDGEERQAIQEVLSSGLLTMGRKVQQFEEEFANHFRAKYAVMVNSGSSANLLAVAATRYSKKHTLLPGDEVLVPAVSWGTTYFPFHQYGLKLRYVDIDLDSLNIDLEQVEAAITPKTRAICAVNLLGAPNDFDRLQAICDRHDLLLLEDNCESMGSTYDGRFTGTFGCMGTFSLYFSHHLCTIEGGVVVTDDKELYHILLSMRAHGWTRNLPAQNSIEDKSGDRFEDAFRFVLPGYNVRPCELNGAIGVEQLTKLPRFLEARRRNAKLFVQELSGLKGIRLQQSVGDSSWFGFSLVLEGALSGRRRELVAHLTEAGIECRPIVAGNFTKNPAADLMESSTHGELVNATKIDVDGFFVGNHHYDLTDQISHLKSKIETFTSTAAALAR